MMKQSIIAFFLLNLLSIQFFEQTGLKLWYEFDNESFTTTFCENIDKPQLECKGNCYLENELLDNIKKTSFPIEKLAPPVELKVFIHPLLLQLKKETLQRNRHLNAQYAFILKEYLPLSSSPPPKS